ncbi:MAG TPA: phosphatidylglycerophosphatase A, partial [Gammaproteobacteria bacterium]|nr:phosphatidylglycerophosphatase A [Gammaproteobacteria bacterium]
METSLTLFSKHHTIILFGKINMLLFIAKWLSLGFGSGKLPHAPGTYGTLVGIPIFLMLADLDLFPYILVCVVLLLIGIWASQVYSDYLGVHDHGSIVWDEVVGYLITMTATPAEWQWIILGFILF